MVFPTYRNPPVVLKPSEEPLDFPSSSIPPEFPTILCFRLLPVCLVRGNHIDAQSCQFIIQRITVVGLVTDNPLGKLDQKASFKRFSDQFYFMRRSAVHVEGDRKTRAVCNAHNFGSFPPFGFPHTRPPFFAGENDPSIKVSRMSRPPLFLRSSANVRRILSNTPSCDHVWCQRWHVDLGGYRSGRSFHCAPVRSIHRMPLSTSRGSFRERPRGSARSKGDGIKGSSSFHCSFDKSISHILFILLQKSSFYFGIASNKSSNPYFFERDATLMISTLGLQISYILNMSIVMLSVSVTLKLSN